MGRPADPPANDEARRDSRARTRPNVTARTILTMSKALCVSYGAVAVVGSIGSDLRVAHLSKDDAWMLHGIGGVEAPQYVSACLSAPLAVSPTCLTRYPAIRKFGPSLFHAEVFTWLQARTGTLTLV